MLIELFTRGPVSCTLRVSSHPPSVIARILQLQSPLFSHVQLNAILHHSVVRDQLFMRLQQEIVAPLDLTGHLNADITLSFATHGKADRQISL